MGIFVGTSEPKSIYVGTTPVKEVYVGTTKVRPTGRQPSQYTVGYYTFDNDMTNHATTTLYSKFPDGVLNTASYSTGQVHTGRSKSLYFTQTNSSGTAGTCAYLPASSLFEFGTSDFTVSVRVYPIAHSGQHTGFICNYYWTSQNRDHKQGWRLSSRFNNNNVLNFCWNATNTGGSSDTWYDNATNIDIDGARHNVVMTRINGYITLYLDGQKVKDANSYPTRNIGRNANIRLGFNSDQNQLYSQGYMNDLIFEKRGRTATEVLDYYSLTA